MVAFHLRSLALATAVVILAAALLAGMVTKHNFPQEVTFRTGHYNKNNNVWLIAVAIMGLWIPLPLRQS